MSNQLIAGQQLNINDKLTSATGAVSIVMQGDGNLVLYRNSDGKALWASHTDQRPVTSTVMQGDGNLVCYDASGHAWWASGTNGHPGSLAALQDDGNFVVYDPAAHPLWASNTHVDSNPMHVDTGDVHVGTGNWLNTTAQVTPSGIISGQTHIWCTVALRGFTGSVCPVLYGSDGRALWPDTPEGAKHQYGVDGYAIPFKTHDRRVSWVNQVDPSIVAQAAALGMISWWDPKNRLLADIPVAAKTIGEIVQAIQLVGSVAAAVA